jgi:hypothetical protein
MHVGTTLDKKTHAVDMAIFGCELECSFSVLHEPHEGTAEEIDKKEVRVTRDHQIRAIITLDNAGLRKENRGCRKQKVDRKEIFQVGLQAYLGHGTASLGRFQLCACTMFLAFVSAPSSRIIRMQSMSPCCETHISAVSPSCAQQA